MNQYLFTGLRINVNKAFELVPGFQTSHTFSIGSQTTPSYIFSTFSGTDDNFIQGNIDDYYRLNGRLNYEWDEQNVSKLNLQCFKGEPKFFLYEHFFQVSDFSINLKALNPSEINYSHNSTAIVTASILQSITPHLILGAETNYHAKKNQTDFLCVARFNAGDWIASAQLHHHDFAAASFWKRINENVQIGIEALYKSCPHGNLITIGAKYEYSDLVFRGQINLKGEFGAFLERRVFPDVSVLLAGEIDPIDMTSKLGIGLSYEASGV